MERRLIAPTIAAVAGLVIFAESAAACSPGYHKVKVQGHWICATNAPASNSLVANTKPAAQNVVRTTPLWGVRMRNRL